MKIPIIKTNPKCDSCGGELVIKELICDNIACCYIINTECILCGEEEYLVLSLDDFIDINRRMLGLDNNGGSDA